MVSTDLENGGHMSLSTKRLVVESLSDIETSNFKALLTYHFLIVLRELCTWYPILGRQIGLIITLLVI